jgi:hypothetical protein
MKSLGFKQLGNSNMRGKKSARYGDDTIQNFKERERILELEREIRDATEIFLRRHD